MKEEIAKAKRKDIVLRVPVLPEERMKIESMAKTAGLCMAEYLRQVGMAYPITTPVERQHLAQLSKINGDLGRLGGLLKLWLTESEKAAGQEEDIRRVLREIENNQQLMKAVLANM